jgi:hypothetical protein
VLVAIVTSKQYTFTKAILPNLVLAIN